MFSSNTITDVNSGWAVTTAYSGSILIDMESGRVLRIKKRYYLRKVIELRNYHMFDTDLNILLEK